MSERPSKLEKAIDYKFQDETLLETALTHRSFGHGNNERLEYLGDAALGFIIADAIFQKFPQATEGELTRLRSSLVKGETLAKLGRELDLGDYIKLGPGEMKSGGWRRDSILANTLEAIIGAVYLDADMKVCQKCVISIYHQLLANVYPGLFQSRTGFCHFIHLPSHIQTTFRRQLFSTFRNQATKFRFDTLGKRQHLLSHRHFQVHWGQHGLT